MIRSLCIYCGSSARAAEKYREGAADVARALAKRGVTIIYGGGGAGLMGIVADAATEAGGRVLGIVPRSLIGERKQNKNKLIELIEVPDMHTRKRMMAERADAFLILPGGLGTLDEAFEIMTWKQLGMHNKRVFVYNLHGFWQPMTALLDHIIAHQFAPLSNRSLYQTISSVPELLAALDLPPDAFLDPKDKWM